jgi:hypothetical protein
MIRRRTTPDIDLSLKIPEAAVLPTARCGCGLRTAPGSSDTAAVGLPGCSLGGMNKGNH